MINAIIVAGLSISFPLLVALFYLLGLDQEFFQYLEKRNLLRKGYKKNK